jgi:hexosaminidase
MIQENKNLDIQSSFIMKMNLLFIISFLALSIKTHSQKISIIPYPTMVQQGKGYFNLNPETVFFFKDGTDQWSHSLEPLQSKLSSAAGFRLNTIQQKSGPQIITIYKLGDTVQNAAYELSISQNRIAIGARNEIGLFYAIQTMIQLFPADIENKELVSHQQWKLPVVIIKDEPAFDYRGLMIDVARHFLPISFLYKMVDQMASLKMNKLHLHLTDDQGWRMEIKKYPLLTAVGSKRDGTLIGRYPGKGNDNVPHQGYYTQQELQALVHYAAVNHIDVIPEIDLPGHSSAAIAAYPALSCFPNESSHLDSTMTSTASLKKAAVPGGKVVQETWGVFQDVLCPTTYTFDFLKDVLNEVMDVFPSPLIHIGGDECPKDNWKRSSVAQEFIRNKNLGDEEGLQSHIIKTLEEFVKARGRRIIGWDEILEGGLAPDATVMSWRGTGGGIQAAQKGHNVIMSPVDVYYLNLYQSEDPVDSIAWGGLTPLKKTYQFNPIPEVLSPKDRAHIKGIQANLWTEYIKSPALAEFMLFPRLMAVAETGWSIDKPGFTHFTKRMQQQFERLEKRGINTSSHLFELAINGKLNSTTKGLQVTLTGTPNGTGLYYAINGAMPKKYKGPFTVMGSGIIKASSLVGKKITDTKTFHFTLAPSTGKSLALSVEPDPAYNLGGNKAPNNGIWGSDTRFNDAEWLGWNGKNVEGIFDFERPTSISFFKTRFFHAPNSWVYLPRQIQILVSDDGINFRMVAEKIIESGNVVSPKQVELHFPTISAQYIKFVAVNHGTIAKGLPGAGFSSWLFMDEVIVQ